MHIAVLDHLMALNEFVKLINIKSADQNMQSYEQQEKNFKTPIKKCHIYITSMMVHFQSKTDN